MSLDHVFYEELVRRKHPAARWWLIGDLLYYIGLLLTIIWPLAGLFAFSVEIIRAGYWNWFTLVIMLACSVAWAAVCAMGVWMKARAYKLARRDGIMPKW